MIEWYLRAFKSIGLTQRKSIIIEWFHRYRVVSPIAQKKSMMMNVVPQA